MFAINGDNKSINKIDINKDELFDAQRCVLDNNQPLKRTKMSIFEIDQDINMGILPNEEDVIDDNEVNKSPIPSHQGPITNSRNNVDYKTIEND